MKQTAKTTIGMKDLRERAENKLSGMKQKDGVFPFGGPYHKDLAEHQAALIEELKICQIELEMQNEDLRQSLAGLGRYTELYDLAPVGYFTFGTNGEILEVNMTGARLLEVERPRLVGKRFGMFLLDSDRPVFKEMLGKMFSRHVACSCEVSLKNKGGEPRWIQIEANASGERGHAAVMDITRRKQAEEARNLLEEQYRLLYEYAPLAYHSLDAEGRIILVNQAWLDSLGHSREEVMGRWLGEFMAPGDAKRFSEDFPRCKAAGKFRSEVDMLKKDGTSVRMAVDVRVAYQKNGAFKQTHSILKDITELKRLAKDAEEASRAKSAFLAHMSHEIRTPLNGIVSMADLLLSSGLAPEQRELAQIVLSSGKALNGIVGDILDFSKIEAGRIELEEQAFDLCELLDDCASLLAVKAHAKGLEFVCAKNPSVPARLLGDSGRLRQILMNLAGNAVKFTERGEVTVEVTRLATSPDEVVLKFLVGDTGIGMTEDVQKRIFNSFSQGDASVTRRFGGTGLGLVISKRLAELMGGEIGVNSWEEVGSEFWFTARFRLQEGGWEEQRFIADQLKGTQALVVDAHAANRRMLVACMEAWGMVAQEATNANAALKMLTDSRETPFQVALVDMCIPDMDGLALGRVIREKQPDLRLVLMTLPGLRCDAILAESAGFAGCLAKPIRQSNLYNGLVAALGGAAFPMPEARHSGHVGIDELRCKKGRVLVAEDHTTNQIAISHLLEKLGMTALVVENGKQAVAELKSNHYDLVLMDVQMPGMDGFEATRLIRDLKSGTLNPEIPIIAMTAHAIQGYREQCFSTGMNDFISKPIEPERLVETINRWVNETPGGAQDDGNQRDELDELAIFDADEVKKRFLGDAAIIRMVLLDFLERTPKRLARIKECAAAKSMEELRIEAHTLRGAAQTIGSRSFTAVTSQLEKVAQLGKTSDVQALLKKVDVEFGRLRRRLILEK